MINCPKCSGEMAHVSYDEIKVDRCISCGGLWFQPDELRTLRDDIWMADYILDTGDKGTGRQANAIKNINCPHCGVLMLQESDEEQRHITYETCPEGHGTFLDAGEFTDLVHKSFWDKFKLAH